MTNFFGRLFRNADNERMGDSQEPNPDASQGDWCAEGPEATLVTSQLWDPGSTFHAPVVDIDMPCRLVESTTPGHYHLYIDAKISWNKYLRMIKAMYEAGIVQKGVYDAAIRRGYTAVRTPWTKKPEKKRRDVVEGRTFTP